MRHRVAGKHLGRNADQRKLLRRGLMNDLFRHECITTTEAKARAVRAEAEKMITIAKRALADGDRSREVAARRLVFARLRDKDIVAKVFSDLAPRYQVRPGGYTRMLKLGLRQGDASKMVLLELVDRPQD